MHDSRVRPAIAMRIVTPGTGDTIYRFGAFELLASRQLLVHAGSPVTVGSRALGILTHLVEQAGSLVSKGDLLAAAWPNIFVHEGNLKVNVANLRRVLAAHDPRQDYIVSVPGRGYRFVCPVRRETAPTVTYKSAVQCASLPVATALVGRSDDVEEIGRELEAHSFVTITGTGGVGKTAVALAAANRMASRFAAGACFIDLASVADERHLVATISAELGVRSDSGDLLGAVIHALRDEHRLLLLDNCEHLLPAVAAAADRLAAALPLTRIIATSREPLRLTRERVRRIAPLACPPGPMPPLGMKAILAFPAVELFARRAREATGNAVAPDDLPAVAEICRRLDGIPLALEIAAARCGAYAPAEVLGLLDDRFDLLDEHDSAKPARQRALRATLAWSYAFLRPQEAAILRALAVFARAFTIEDALAIAQATEVAPVEALESIASLISKSLLSPDGREDGTRYRLLESTRAFAADLLRADPVRRRVQQRHAEHVCLSLERAQDAWHRASGAHEQADPSRWAADVRRALTWALGDDGSIPLGIRLTISAIPMWESFSMLDESVVYLGMAIERGRLRGPEVPAAEIRLQTALATALFHARGLTRQTAAALQRALTLSETFGQPDDVMTALWGCAVHDLHAGRPARTIERMRRFDQLGRALADPSLVPDGERLRAAAEMYLGHLASASARLERVLSTRDRGGGPSGKMMFQLHRGLAAGSTLAMVTWLTGDRAGAARLAERTIAGAIAAEHPVSLCNALVQHALTIALLDGRLEDAQRYLNLLREQFAGGGLRWWAQLARCPAAALAVRRGEAGGLARLQRDILDVAATGTSLRIPAYMGMLADALGEAGRLMQAERVIETALARAAVQQERWIVPELRRIEAGVRARQGQPAQAEHLLKAAIGLAREMGAESWRARAQADLSRLRSARGMPAPRPDLREDAVPLPLPS
ncbi:ATP-binding protein [Methylobacterium sp. ID0610]|uniref:ATP-binding protein n=1 Tax=Methylobacterium carpenticola TaxID=3344827 RepID=UPI00369D32E6